MSSTGIAERRTTASATLPYIARFWLGIFAGPPRVAVATIPRLLSAPIILLGCLTVIGGLVVQPFAEHAASAAGVINGADVDVHPAYHLDARTENVMAVLAWALALAIGSLFGFLSLLDYLWPLWDSKRQALHDKLADTQVVVGKQPRRQA